MLNLVLPKDYPLSAPDFIVKTPSGRFAVGHKVCTSFSSFHPESWTPSYRLETLLVSFVSFMTDTSNAAGVVHTSDVEKKAHAAASIAFNKHHKFGKLLPLVEFAAAPPGAATASADLSAAAPASAAAAATAKAAKEARKAAKAVKAEAKAQAVAAARQTLAVAHAQHAKEQAAAAAKAQAAAAKAAARTQAAAKRSAAAMEAAQAGVAAKRQRSGSSVGSSGAVVDLSSGPAVSLSGACAAPPRAAPADEVCIDLT